MPFALTTTDGLLAAAAVSLCYHLYTRKSVLPLPPGPKGWPLIGNVLDMPKSHAWKTFAQWGDIYGKLHAADKLINANAIFRRDHVDYYAGPTVRHNQRPGDCGRNFGQERQYVCRSAYPRDGQHEWMGPRIEQC
jgi:hypothetical protein